MQFFQSLNNFCEGDSEPKLDSHKYEHINVSGVKLSRNKDGLLATSKNLCLDVKSKEGAFVHSYYDLSKTFSKIKSRLVPYTAEIWYS